ncbi:MAG: ComEC/Rec2 family competence protein [Alphaproteobacteria bacterium]|nr:ComEC/Rec2 family competence protein [Alphaproteobacteria bacterium]MBL0717757.1 ComEC/Rec2 family competence protein [Alphaproteobacteria bacterium]
MSRIRYLLSNILKKIELFFSRHYNDGYYTLWFPFIVGLSLLVCIIPLKTQVSILTLFILYTSVVLVISCKLFPVFLSSTNRFLKLLVIGFSLGLLSFILHVNYLDIGRVSEARHNVDILCNVDNLSKTSHGYRLYCKDIKLTDDRNSFQEDYRVRFKVNKDILYDVPKIGDEVKFRGSIYPIEVGIFKGLFDFSLWSFFNDINGTGNMTHLYYKKSTEGDLTIGERVSEFRKYLYNKIETAPFVSPLVKSFSQSLIIGQKHSLPSDTFEQYRSLGLAHLLSISGFHMSLLFFWAYFILYLFFKNFTILLRRYNLRPVISLLSVLVCFIYLTLSGFQTPTLRAFIGLSLFVLGLLFVRSIISYRSLSIIATIILLSRPYSVISPGFYLSFLSVICLLSIKNIVISKKIYTHIYDDKDKFRIVYIIWSYIRGIIISSIVISIVISPLLVYFFGTVPLLSVIGNIIAMPIYSFLVMPLLLLGSIIFFMSGNSSILNLTEPILKTLHNIFNLILEIPITELKIPVLPQSFYIYFFAGFILSIILLREYKKIGYIVMFISIPILFFPRSDTFMFISPEITTIAVKVDGNDYGLTNRASDNRFLENLKRLWGVKKFTSYKNENSVYDIGVNQISILYNSAGLHIKTINENHINDSYVFIPKSNIALIENLSKVCSVKNSIIISTMSLSYNINTVESEKCKSLLITKNQIPRTSTTYLRLEKIKNNQDGEDLVIRYYTHPMLRPWHRLSPPSID